MKTPVLALFLALPLAAAGGESGRTNAHEAEPEALGRLFFTPHQRIALERPGDGPAMEDRLRLEGIVRRSSGRKSFWINGRLRHDEAAPPGVEIRFPDRSHAAALIKDDTRTPVMVRVGESIDSASGERQPLIPERSLRIHSRNMP
ncbi:hypothetical protein B9N43_07875 [Denitratisoma sp. DHT3]|uniref:hypothetical protein n=1 Tax=Denitratisoma sp. DHT3 TaxID=1981880 RepID=UPI0011984C47|nr:hypothetical protein [Denitratisoma sp. DHT3]QDX81164.1 hypothetical protein B9N43_07875 [Denitratisoma sp. DHT3]